MNAFFGLIAELKKRSPLLFGLITLHLSLAALETAGLLLDARTVDGTNPWIKPEKFNLSIAVFAATIAWILPYAPARLAKRTAVGICVAMIIESLCITIQAARGVGSHFNVEGSLNPFLYAVMGLAIAFNTFVLVRLCVGFFRSTPHIPRPYLAGIRWGLVSLIVGSLIGGYMSGKNSHSVGPELVAAQIPFVGWNTNRGDLRIAHFFGLHGVQVLVALGAAISRTRLSSRSATRLVFIAFLIYSFATAFLFLEATRGRFPFSW